MLQIICDMCQEGLEEPGGLLFSPPDIASACFKYHFCVTCYEDIKEMIRP